jgi:DNA-binding PadR family transcriptional regulator
MSRENRSKYAILGFLDLMPMSGYDIRKFAAASLSHFWNEDYGHIYPALRLLVSEGLAESATEAGQGKPDRKVYSITERGREELRRWLHLDPQRTNFRHELLLKAFFASRISGERFREMLAAEAASCERALADLRAIEPHIEGEIAAGGERAREARFQRMTLRFGLRYYEASRDWCRETMEEL